MVGRLVAVVVLAALPGLAAKSATITARDFVFEPAAVEITAGETVTLDNAQGFHSFVFADESLPTNPAPDTDPAWPQRKTFPTAGTYAFHCGAHPNMTGTVTVVAPAATPTPTPTPTPQPQPALTIRTLRMAGGPFCTRCRRPGARLRVDLSAAAHVRGTLRRTGRRARALDLGTIEAGPRTVTFGRRLAAGRYTLRLRAGDLAPRTLRFRMRTRR
jgi:plastocyanin